MRQGFKSWTTHRDRTVCIRKLVGFGPGSAARILASFNMAADTPFLRPDTHTPRPAEGHEPIGPGRRENPLISADVVKSSGLLGSRGNGCLAEREGFEPSIRFWRILTLDRKSTRLNSSH